MPANSEATVNVQLGEVLRAKHPGWRDGIGAEQSQVFLEAARRPDIVVRHPGGQIVIMETEFAPGRTVEADARVRLGAVVKGTNHEVEQAIAVVLPEDLKEGQHDLAERIAATRFRYAVFSVVSDAQERRWPEAGWMTGTVDDLACCIEHASLSERRIAEGAKQLELGVSQAAARVQQWGAWRKTNTLELIAARLHQVKSEQTTRMAMAIIANALVFHHNIAGAHGIPSFDQLRFDHRPELNYVELVKCWRRVLREINYWPIFKIAADLLGPMPHYIATDVLERLEKVALDMVSTGMASTHDLSGQMFQRLIVDRKFLATFYTLPASAMLLAELAVSRLDVDWENAKAVTGLRIADLACGTGALLNAAYQAVRMRHRHKGRDDAELHSAMMEKVLFAADIMPAATHLTASILSGAHPTVTFADTRIVTMPYGEQPSESGHPLSIGSLDLLAGETARSVLETGAGTQLDAFGTGRKQVRGTGDSAEASDPHAVEFAHESGDLLIMNPPFTRPTNHESTTIPVPSFAGFDTSRAEQKAMSSQLAKLRKGIAAPAGAGNAGLASYFVDLVHVKTKPGGVVALVLPAAFVQGASWEAARSLMRRHYRDLVVVSIAASGATDRAFSADTGMAEVLVVGTKNRNLDSPSGDTLFVNLRNRPRSLAEAAALAGAVRDLPAEHRSGLLRLGDVHPAGNFVRAPLDEGGCAAVRELALAQAMLSLQEGELRLPRTTWCGAAPVTRLGNLGRRGKLHRDISGTHPDGTPRGPFDVVVAGDRPVYPILWSHKAEHERNLVVAPRQEGMVREGMDERAAVLWERTASHLHFNLDFRLNSQSLAACLTPSKCIGGTAWPSFVVDREEWEKALVLWANSTLGLICFWWAGARQQQGRARLTISRLPTLLVLDPRRLSEAQIGSAARVFDEFRDRELLPANEAYRDKVRHELDRALLVDVLGLSPKLLDPISALRGAWCAEPTVHGGKTTRPD